LNRALCAGLKSISKFHHEPAGFSRNACHMLARAVLIIIGSSFPYRAYVSKNFCIIIWSVTHCYPPN